MLDKSKVEYSIDKDKYQLPKHCCIWTNALYINSVNSFSLKYNEKSFYLNYLLKNYKVIVRNFFEEQYQ